MDATTIAALAGAIGTLVGAIVGASASLGGAYLNNRTAWKIKKESMLAEREEQRRAFQRETLLKLQDALQRYLRFAGRQNFEDEANFRKTGIWGRTPLSEEVNTGITEAGTEVLKLTARVTDESLRAEIDRLNTTIGQLTFTKSQVEAERVMEHIANDGVAAMVHVGALLRTHL